MEMLGFVLFLSRSEAEFMCTSLMKVLVTKSIPTNNKHCLACRCMSPSSPAFLQRVREESSRFLRISWLISHQALCLSRTVQVSQNQDLKSRPRAAFGAGRV